MLFLFFVMLAPDDGVVVILGPSAAVVGRVDLLERVRLPLDDVTLRQLLLLLPLRRNRILNTGRRLLVSLGVRRLVLIVKILVFGVGR
jgi:hypothetical protein